jgi:excisionase family DNA binding protein
VEQVADMLGLHVKTVRAHVRDGRLKAVRIGKQYRIAREDLEALTGGAAPVPGRDAERDRHAEVSSIVHVHVEHRLIVGRRAVTPVAARSKPAEQLGVRRVHACGDSCITSSAEVCCDA